jgi:hypothetical protein
VKAEGLVHAEYLRHRSGTVAAIPPKNKSPAARFQASAEQDSPVPMSLPIVPSYSVSSEKAAELYGILLKSCLKTDSHGNLFESL